MVEEKFGLALHRRPSFSFVKSPKVHINVDVHNAAKLLLFAASS
jgi:hypothetical protein